MLIQGMEILCVICEELGVGACTNFSNFNLPKRRNNDLKKE